MKPDIVLVTESWCNDVTTNAMLTLPGYDLQLRADREDTTAGVGGGLLVYARQDVVILPEEKRYAFTQHVDFKIVSNGEELNMTLVYRPPKQTAETHRMLADFIHSTKGNLILIGDFNIPGIDCKNGHARSASLHEILTACQDEFLEQMLDFPTHVRGNCLDLLLTNVIEKIVSISDVGRLRSSDHSMLLTEISFGKKTSQETGKVRNW
jgi:hypothetical protein